MMNIFKLIGILMIPCLLNTQIFGAQLPQAAAVPAHIQELQVQKKILEAIKELAQKFEAQKGDAPQEPILGADHSTIAQLSIIHNLLTSIREHQQKAEMRAQEQEQRLLLLGSKLNKMIPGSNVDPIAQMADDDYNLGKMAYFGLYGMKVSFENAAKHFENILNQKVNKFALAGAYCYLGQMYYYGHAKPVDLKKAFDYFSQAEGLVLDPDAAEKKAANEEARAISRYFLGRLHYDYKRNKAQYNIDTAVRFLDSVASQQLDSQARQGANFFLGKIYRKEKQRHDPTATIKQDVARAEKCLGIALENKEFKVRASYYLATMALAKKNTPQVIKFLSDVVDAQKIEENEKKLQARAFYELGKIAVDDDFKSFSREIAREFLQKAASQDNDTITRELAKKELRNVMPLALDNK